MNVYSLTAEAQTPNQPTMHRWEWWKNLLQFWTNNFATGEPELTYRLGRHVADHQVHSALTYLIFEMSSVDAKRQQNDISWVLYELMIYNTDVLLVLLPHDGKNCQFVNCYHLIQITQNKDIICEMTSASRECDFRTLWNLTPAQCAHLVKFKSKTIQYQGHLWR